jgi:hypothetical protein
MINQSVITKCVLPFSGGRIAKLYTHTSIISKQLCLIRPLENWSMGYCVYCFQLFNKNGWNPVSGFAKICKNQ